MDQIVTPSHPQIHVHPEPVTMTLFGNGVFAVVTKFEMRPKRIRAGLKPRLARSSKRRDRVNTETRTHGGEGQAEVEAEMGGAATCPATPATPGAGGGGKGAWRRPHGDSGLSASRTVREYTSLVVSRQFVAHCSRRPGRPLSSCMLLSGAQGPRTAWLGGGRWGHAGGMGGPIL